MVLYALLTEFDLLAPYILYYCHIMWMDLSAQSVINT